MAMYKTSGNQMTDDGEEEAEDHCVKSALNTIASVTKNLASTVETICRDIASKNLKDGISLLTVKEKLIVFYLQFVTEFMKKKVEGDRIEGSSVIERLAEIRVYLERVNPIEKKLKYHIDKMLKTATVGSTDKNDPSRFRANPASMSLQNNNEEEEEEQSDEDENKKKAGVYVPPKLSAVHYDGDENRTQRRQKILDRARKRALQSSVMQELKEEYLDTPVEVRATNTLKQMEDKWQKRKREYEEQYFTRLPITKEEVKRAKRISTIGSLGDELTHFEDTSVLHGETSSLKKSKSKKKVKARVAKIAKKMGKKKFKR